MLPTILVCPLQEGLPLTGLRVEVDGKGRPLVALCELARRVMETFRLLLAR